MEPYWKTTNSTDRLERREQVQSLIQISLQEAQQYVNFVVFRPSWLPADCIMTETSMRPEQPPGRPGDVEPEEIGQTPWTKANPCSLRSVYNGRGRQFRLKQFLYDWAPPAASTAPLWNSPRLTPVVGEDAIAWLGMDYNKRPGGCVQLKRTQLEISVTEGSFSEDELGRILIKLTPASSPEARREVEQAPFHLLNYWVRYQQRGVKVPYGLWAYSQARHYDKSRIVRLEKLRVNPPVRLLFPGDDPYVFDSAVYITSEQPYHCEVELIYRHNRNLSDHLWISAMDRRSELAHTIPPAAEKHLAETRGVQRMRSLDVWYAALSERYGAWEAFWEETGVHYAVWAGSSAFQDANEFKEVVSSFGAA